MTIRSHRHLVLILICCLAGGLGTAQTSGQDWDRPIPQDPAQQEKRARERLAWHRKTLVESYNKVGKKNPARDDAARQALEAVARFYAKAVDPPTTRQEVYRLLEAATAGGTDDPLLLFFKVHEGLWLNQFVPDRDAEWYARAADGMTNSEYPAIWRSYVLASTGNDLSKKRNKSHEDFREADRRLFQALAYLPASAAADKTSPDNELYRQTVISIVLDGHRVQVGDWDKAMREVGVILEPHPSLRVAWLKARALFLISYAWEARGTGYGDTVTAEGARKMEERIAEAKKSLDEAWALAPGDGSVATCQLKLMIGRGDDRVEMERWFERAMKADGDNLDACQAKMYWLEPKWYGSVEEMIAFGQRCGDTRNWRAKLTIEEPNAYITALAPNDTDPPVAEFWKSPAVWKRVKAVYDDGLLHEPANHVRRSRYAAVAYLSGQFVEANRQFTKLGDNLTASTNFPLPWLQAARTESAKKSKGIKILDQPAPK